MNKLGLYVSMIGLGFVLIAAPQSTGAQSEPSKDYTFQQNETQSHRHHMMKEDYHSLRDQGFPKKEIFKAYHIARLAKKPVKEVLAKYKETKSWDKTADHYGVDRAELEKQKRKWKERKARIQSHKGEIISYLSEYTEKDAKDLSTYMKEVRLHHLIHAAVVSKMSGTDLADVIQYKKEKHSRDEMKAKFNLDRETYKAEMKKVCAKIDQIIEK